MQPTVAHKRVPSLFHPYRSRVGKEWRGTHLKSARVSWGEKPWMAQEECLHTRLSCPLAWWRMQQYVFVSRRPPSAPRSWRAQDDDPPQVWTKYFVLREFPAFERCCGRIDRGEWRPPALLNIVEVCIILYVSRDRAEVPFCSTRTPKLSLLSAVACLCGFDFPGGQSLPQHQHEDLF